MKDATAGTRGVAGAEQRRLAMYRHSQEAVVLLGEDLRVLDATANLEKVLGRRLDKLGGAGLDALLPPIPAAEIAAAIPRLEAGGGPVTLQASSAGPAGGMRHLELVLSDQRADPSLGAFAVNVRDVTAAREALLALESSEARFRAMVQLNDDLVVLLDASGQILWVNDRVEGMLGWRPESIQGAWAWDYLAPEDRDEAAAELAELLQGHDERRAVISHVRTAGGGYSCLEFTAANLLEVPEVGAVVVSARQVDERQQAEEALRRSEARVLALLHNANDVIEILDRDGRLIWVTPGIQAIVGRSPQEMIGSDALDLVHPDDIGRASKAFREVLASPSGASARSEIRVLLPNGDVRWIDIILSNRLDHEDIGGIVVNVRDITQRKVMEERLAYQATHDPLTGLPNRLLLLDRLGLALARTERSGTRVAVLFLDLNRFKVVNDTFGHTAGDSLLVEAAARLRSVVRPGDTVARFGGDEFVVLCEDVEADEVGNAMAERISEALAKPVRLAGSEVIVTASIGVAFSSPADRDAVALIRAADAAMYRAKEGGGAPH